MVWPQLFIQSHHVPLLSTIPRLADLLNLPLQRSIHTTPLLLQYMERNEPLGPAPFHQQISYGCGSTLFTFFHGGIPLRLHYVLCLKLREDFVSGRQLKMYYQTH